MGQRVQSGSRRGAFARHLNIERLEDRRLLSVNVDIATRVDSSSVAAGGTSHYFELPLYAVSANGRYVAFVSNASNIVSGVSLTPGADNIYRYDRLTGDVVLVSADVTGTRGANSNCVMPQISANGNVVAFLSFASNLHPLDSNNQDDIFVRNLLTGTTQIASLNFAGTASGNGLSVWPSMSADGSVIAFLSRANNLHPLDSDTNWDIYARDLVTGSTQLVSVNAAGTDPSNESNFGYAIGYPVLSANGRVVAFRSEATDLHPLDTDDAGDVFARDLISGETHLVSVNVAGTGGGNMGGNERSANPVISADGTVVAFTSYASGLHPLDTEFGGGDSRADVYARDLVAGITHLVSINFAGTNSGEGESYSPSISADGNVIAFESGAYDLLPTTTGTVEIYARNLTLGTTQLVSINKLGTGGGNSFSWSPQISADGKVVVFESDASNLHPLDTDYNPEDDLDVFAHDLATGVTQLLSVNATGNSAGNKESRTPVVSGDGSVVVFRSDASDLVAEDNNNLYDVFVATVTWSLPELQGDYNADDTVDAADFVVWRKNLGMAVTPFTGADGSGNGIVDQADYGAWRANFGRTGAAGSTELGSGSGGQGAESVAQGVGSEVAAARALAEPVAHAGQPGVFGVARPELPAMGVAVAGTSRENHALRLGLRDVPHAAVSHDRALLAWLAARVSGPRREAVAADFFELQRESGGGRFLTGVRDAFDLAFASIGDDGRRNLDVCP